MGSDCWLSDRGVSRAQQLVSDLDAYLKDPIATEQRFLKVSVNQGVLGAVQTPTQGANTMSERAYREREREMVSTVSNQLTPATDRG